MDEMKKLSEEDFEEYREMFQDVYDIDEYEGKETVVTLDDIGWTIIS